MKFSAIVLVTLAAFATTASGQDPSSLLVATPDCVDDEGNRVGKMLACEE